MTRSAQPAVLKARPLKVALAASVAALFAGSAAAQAPAPAPAAPAATSAPAADPVVVIINGTPIRASDVILAEEDIGPGLPPQLQGEQRRDYVLSFLTDMTLLSQAAAAQKLDQTPEFAQRLAYARTKALMEALMSKEARGAVTDEAKRKTYDEFVKSAPAEQEVRARHILVEDETQAKEIARKARAGEDFAKLAKENSKDSADDGGDLGYFTKEQMVPEFADAAFKLEKGQVSDPVKSQFGWHVIKLEDKRQKPVPTFEQVQDQLDQYLVRKAQADLVTKLRADAKVETPGAEPEKK